MRKYEKEEESSSDIEGGMQHADAPHSAQAERASKQGGSGSAAAPDPVQAKNDEGGAAQNVMDWFAKRNGETLQGARSFVPWILQASYTPCSP